MRTLFLKSWRDLRARHWQALGLVLLVATIVGAAGGATHAGRMMVHTRAVYQRELAVADLEIRCSPVLPGLIERVQTVPGIAAAEESLVLGGVLHSRAPHPLPASIRVLRPERATINRLDLLAGRYPGPQEHGVVIDRSLEAVFGLTVGDDVELELHGARRSLPVLGISISPDHIIFPCHPEYLFPVPGTVAALALSPASAAEFPDTDLVNLLLFRFVPGADAAAMEKTLLDDLGVSPIAVFAHEDAPDQRATSMILRFFDVYIPAGLSVLIAVAITLLVLTLTRMVRSQERQIGVLVSLGNHPGTIAAGYVVLPVVAGLAGALLGALAHGPYARFIYDSYATSVGYAPLRDPGPGPELPLISAACIALATVLAYGLALLTAIRSPHDLLQGAPPHLHGFRPIARLFAFARRLVPMPRSIVLGMTYLSRRPWVSVATVICLGFNLAMVAAYIYVHITHVVETEANMNRLGRDATVHFSAPVAESSLAAIASDVDGTAEPMIPANLLVEFPGRRMLHRTLCVEPDGWVRAMPIVRGRALTDADTQAVLIDQWVADAHHVNVGDKLACYPWFSAPESRTYEIVGVFGGPSHGLLLMPLEAGQVLLDLPGLCTAASVSSPLPPAPLEARLRTLPDVESVQSLTRARRRVGETFAGLERVLAVSVVLAILVSVIFIGLLAALDASERAPDLAILRALGWRDRSILALCLSEVLTRGLLAFLFAVPLSPLVALWLLDRLQAANRYRLELVAPWWVLVAIGVACAVLMPLGAIPAWHAARRVSPGRAVRLLASE